MTSRQYQKLLKPIIALIIFVVLAGITSINNNQDQETDNQVLSENTSEAYVTKVVDGDTIKVDAHGTSQTVRIIGINTPETVDPRKPVECYGKQASDYMKSLLEDEKIELIPDSTQANQDKYGRILRYVNHNGEDIGLNLIQNGFAYEYTYDIPYQRQKKYKDAQNYAEDNNLGLWSDYACPDN